MDSTAPPHRSGMLPAIACATLLLAFLAAAGWFSIAIPLGEGPDEPGHAEYVFFVARTGRLPDQRLDDVPGEGHQPPLAYWLMRPAALAAPRPLRQVHLTANPRWLWTGGDETAAFSRRSVDFFPYRDDARAWHLMRLFSIGCGALTVLLAYGCGRRLGLGWQPALLCAALLAFWPQFLFHSALVSNDPPLWTLAALLLWLLLDPRLPAAPPRWLIPAIGLVFGAALLTKQSALAFGPLIALGLWRARRRWAALGLAFGAAALAAGWWYGRNLALYGDLFGLTAYHGAFESPPFKPWLGAHWAAAGRALGSSMVARFGWMNLSPPGWVYGFAVGLAALAVQGWLIGRPGIRRQRAFPLAAAPGDAPADRLLLALALPALALAWTVLFALIGGQVAWQGRFVLPAGPALALGLGGGLWRLGGRWLLGGAVAALLLLACWLPARVIAPAYPALTVAARPDSPSLGRWSPDSGSPFELRELVALPAARPGDRLEVHTLWTTSGRQDRPWTLFIHLARPGEDDPVADLDVQPQGGAFPATRWTQDDWWEDTAALALPADLPAGEYELRLGWFDEATFQRVGLRSPRGELLGDYLVAGRVRVGP